MAWDRVANLREIENVRKMWKVSGVRIGDVAARFILPPNRKSINPGYLSSLLQGKPKRRLKLSDLRRLRAIVGQLSHKG